MWWWRACWVGLVVTPAVARAGPGIVVHLPGGSRPTAAAVAVARNASLNRPAAVDGDTVVVPDVKLGVAYDLRVTLAGGTVLQGVDLGWYSRVPPKPNAEPLTDDDRTAMADVCRQVVSFYSHSDPLLIRGTHERAVMLVDLRRDTDFHSSKDGREVIWRPELWYFENHHGGWEKVQQTDRDLRRERFADAAAYHAVVDHLRWVPELGGLKVRPGGADLAVTLPAGAGLPATRPSATEASAGAGPSTRR